MVRKRQKKKPVTKTMKKKPSIEDKWYKYKPMIQFLKTHSTFLKGLYMFYRNANNFTYKDSTELALVAFSNMYDIPRQRFTPPSVYLMFDSERNELELNLLMKYGPLRQKDLELLGQHNITKECSINLLENNELFDWGYIGVYSCNDADDIRENGQQKALEYVERYVDQRNKTMVRLQKIKKEHKGKFIIRKQLNYEIVLYMSNYFELMFKYLEQEELQGDEEQYKGTYYENWFNTDVEEVKTRIERWQDYVVAREKWKMNDGWEVVDNQRDLYKQRFKYFLRESNVRDLAANYAMLNSNDMIKKFYQLWVAGVAVKNLTFKTVLTYEKFKAETNVQKIVQTTLHRSKKLSKRNFERVLRTFYNQEVVNAKTLPADVKFIGDRNLNHYFLATRLNETNEYEEFDEAHEEAFMAECEKERATSSNQCEEEAIKEWWSGTNSSSLAERIESLINQVLGKDNDMEHSTSVSEGQESDMSSSEEPELIEYENLGLVPAEYYKDATEHNYTRSSELNQRDVIISPVTTLNELEAMTRDKSNEALSVSQEPLPTPTCHYPLPDMEAECTSLTLPNSEAPIQVQDINTSNLQMRRSSSRTPNTSSSDVTLSENEATIIHKPSTSRRRSLRLSNIQRFVDDILDVNPDEPIGDLLASSTPLRIPMPLRRSQRRDSISKMVLQRQVEKQMKSNSPRPVTRSQMRYLTVEETLERATFNGMSPSIR